MIPVSAFLHVLAEGMRANVPACLEALHACAPALSVAVVTALCAPESATFQDPRPALFEAWFLMALSTARLPVGTPGAKELVGVSTCITVRLLVSRRLKKRPDGTGWGPRPGDGDFDGPHTLTVNNFLGKGLAERATAAAVVGVGLQVGPP